MGADGAILARWLGSELVFQAELFALFLVFLDQLLRCHDGLMDGVKGKVGEERLVFVFADESRGLVRQAGGEKFAVGTILKERISVWGKVFFSAVGTAPIESSLVDIETVVLWEKSFVSQMPFPREEGGVPLLFQGLRKRRVGVGEVVDVGCRPDGKLDHVTPIGVLRECQEMRFRRVVGRHRILELVRRTEIIGVMSAGRILAGHDRGACRRADGTTRVSVGEIHGGLREIFQMRRFVKRVRSIDIDVLHPEIIDEKEDDVAGLLGGVEERGQKERG